MKNKIKLILIASVVLCSIFSPNAYGQTEGPDITNEITCTISTGASSNKLLDDNYQTYWHTQKAADKYIQIECAQPISYLYVCYIYKPSSLIIQSSSDGSTWQDIAYESPSEYNHILYTLDTPSTSLRIYAPTHSEGSFGVNEIKALSQGALPSYIQQWKPTWDKADILIFAAHPDDEAVFFSGIIPYYAGEQDKKVIVSYLTTNPIFRCSETLNYLWTMHENHLPLYANFEDVYCEGTSYAQKIWGYEKTIDYMVNVIRQRKPDIIISHDLNGEYGHGQHMFTAEALKQAVLLASDATYHTSSYEEFGPHLVKKLYLHLYEENQIRLDVFDDPLEEYDGLSAIDIAQIGILEYASQLHFQVVRVHLDDSPTTCYNYGLAYSSVGLDTIGKDIFENIPLEPTPTFTPLPTSTPEATPTNVAVVTATAPVPTNSIDNMSMPIFYILIGLVIILILIIILMLINKKQKVR